MIKRNVSLFLFCLIVLAGKIFAQDLPIGYTAQEKLMMKDYYFSHSKGTTSVTPPLSSLRTPGEWEEIQALTITWTSYTSVLREIVRYAAQECIVYINCTDSNSVKSYLQSGSVSLTNIRYIIAPNNSVWIRDYGAQTVYTNEVDSVLLIDWTYNRPRPKDDTIPRSLAKITGLPLYELNQQPWKIVATGGNFMADGLGTAFSSKLILDENASGGGYNQNLTESDVDTIYKKFMGITRYIKMNTLPYDGIHHIDMHMKLLDEETLLVGQYPSGIADGSQIEANIQYVLSNFTSAFGKPYRIIRIPMPPDNTSGNTYPDNGGDYLTFTNGVFVNKTFLYPTYYTQYDTIAQRIYEQALPGYQVVGINCSQTIPASGAIHCITNSVGSSDPLLIVHQPIRDSLLPQNEFQTEIKAYIKHRTGIQSAQLHYKIFFGNMMWDSVVSQMSPVTNESGYWSGLITYPMLIKTVVDTIRIEYFISATSVSGKTQVRPITAPLGSWKYSKLHSMSKVKEVPHNVFLDKVYPNPANSITCIPVISNCKTLAEIMLYDISGRVVKKIFEGTLYNGCQNFFFDATSLAKGVYTLLLKTERNILIQKVMVK
jgi:agmatine deiminase